MFRVHVTKTAIRFFTFSLVGLVPWLAQADIVTNYSDRVVFDSATSHLDLGMETFEEIGVGQFQAPFISTNSLGFQLTQPGAEYASSAKVAIRDDANFSSPDGQRVFYGVFNPTQTNNKEITITFDTPQQAFAFDTNKSMGTDFDMTIHFTSGPDYMTRYSSMQSDYSELMFFGWMSDSRDITSVTISGNGDGTFENGQDGSEPSNIAFLIDNVTFTASAVPEPTAIAFWLLACGVVSAIRFRRKN